MSPLAEYTYRQFTSPAGCINCQPTLSLSSLARRTECQHTEYNRTVFIIAANTQHSHVFTGRVYCECKPCNTTSDHQQLVFKSIFTSKMYLLTSGQTQLIFTTWMQRLKQPGFVLIMLTPFTSALQYVFCDLFLAFISTAVGLPPPPPPSYWSCLW